jgi:aspartate carbamoyltransferase catalytic subunit
VEQKGEQLRWVAIIGVMVAFRAMAIIQIATERQDQRRSDIQAAIRLAAAGVVLVIGFVSGSWATNAILMMLALICAVQIGVDLVLVGPANLLPEAPPPGIEVSTDIDAVLEDRDVVYLLRVQRERGGQVEDDYHRHYGMTPQRAQSLPATSVIMHPGPINRGVEIDPEVADGPRSLILEQVACGVPVRMAVLAAVGGTA